MNGDPPTLKIRNESNRNGPMNHLVQQNPTSKKKSMKQRKTQKPEVRQTIGGVRKISHTRPGREERRITNPEVEVSRGLRVAFRKEKRWEES